MMMKKCPFFQVFTNTALFHHKRLIDILYLFYRRVGNKHRNYTIKSFSRELLCQSGTVLSVVTCVTVVSVYEPSTSPQFTSEHLR